MAVKVNVLRNGSLLTKVAKFDELIKDETQGSIERGEVIFMGEKSGVFVTVSRVYAIFDVASVDEKSSLRRGQEYACRVVRDSSTNISIAVPPFRSGRGLMELGQVTKVPSGNKSPGSLIWRKTGKQLSFDANNIGRSSEVRIGDVVWFNPAGDRALEVALCTPKGEPMFDSQPANENPEETLREYFDNDDGDEPKRYCGTISSIKENFAFVHPDKGAELFMPFSELCLSSPGFERTNLRVNDFVTFEIKKSNGEKDSDVATRVFHLPSMTRAKWKRCKEVILAQNGRGKIVSASAKAVKAIEYDVMSIKCERPEIWDTLKNLKTGETFDASQKSTRMKSLISQYCKWLGNGLQYDPTTGLVQRTEVETSESREQVAIVPCYMELTEGSEESYNVLDQVTFDLYFDTSNGKRFAVVVPETVSYREVTLAPGEVEQGVISSVSPGLIISTRRESKVKIQSVLGGAQLKVGDVVTFRVEPDRYGTLPLAFDVKKTLDLDDAKDKIGLLPLDSNLRLKGVVMREMPKFLSSGNKADALALQLQNSFSSGPRSGIISLGPVALQLNQSKPAASGAVETEDKTSVLDWRRENELFRMVRSCKERETTDDPIHIFRGLSQSEQRAVEKEAKKQSLLVRQKDNLYALARRKASLKEWSSKLGRRVRVQPFGEGCVVDVRVRDSVGTVLSVGLFPVGDEPKYGAHLYCIETPTLVIDYLDQPKDVSKQTDDTLGADVGQSPQEQAEQLVSELRTWIHQGAIPSQAIQVISASRVVFPDAKHVVDACLVECLPFKRLPDSKIIVACDVGKDDTLLSREELIADGITLNFGFAFEPSNNQVFPVEGDLVEFTPCRSTASGVLRATDIKLIKARVDRTTGTVEEMTSKGGWVRPSGKLSAEFYANDLVTKNISVGDIVDFVLSDKGDRAMRVRFLQVNPKPTSSPPPSGLGQSILSAERPRINQELMASAPNASSGAAYVQAPGPDDTIGFTKDKWRNKRLISNLSAAAPEFTPPVLLVESLVAVSPPPTTVDQKSSSAHSKGKNSTAVGSAKDKMKLDGVSTESKPKFRVDAPEFVPPSFMPSARNNPKTG